MLTDNSIMRNQKKKKNRSNINEWQKDKRMTQNE